jgi:GPH family glycoside/pentoside/hexuronide:cation symporter
LFGGLPYAVVFALIFTVPFDGKDNPIGLLAYFGIMIVVWEGLYTALATGYYGLLPEMFGIYRERTDVAAKMNIFQTIALVLGAALPPLLAEILGWSGMACACGHPIIAIYLGYPALPRLENRHQFPLGQPKATFQSQLSHRRRRTGYAFLCHRPCRWHPST